VVPIDAEADLDFSHAGSAGAEELEDAGRRLRAALADLGHPLA
jgi:hypothetical protein